MKYQIDNDVPRQSIRKTSGSPTKYPFKNMAVGGSFFVPVSDGGNPISAASHAGKRNGFKFSSEKRVESGIEGFRIWRIK